MTIAPKTRTAMMVGGTLEIIGGLLGVYCALHLHQVVAGVVAPLLLLSGILAIAVASKSH